MDFTFVILGVTGDLAKNKLIPAACKLLKNNNFQVKGLRKDHNKCNTWGLNSIRKIGRNRNCLENNRQNKKRKIIKPRKGTYSQQADKLTNWHLEIK